MKSFHLYPEPFLLPPESKCINIPFWVGWDIWSSLEHFGLKLINVIKYLASPGYQISACVSAVTAIISVYMFISLPTFLAILLISLLSPDMTPSLSPLARFNYPGAGGQAGSSGCILLLCTLTTLPPPPPFTFWIPLTCINCPRSHPPGVLCLSWLLSLPWFAFCTHNSQARPSSRISQTDS